MRLWHYKLIPVLPNDMLVSQWRECIAIKRQWEKGTLKHRLVSYVDNYNKQYFLNYVHRVMDEMNRRNIKYQDKYYNELRMFCWNGAFVSNNLMFQEHNDRYLKQCYYNLQEKYDRGIVSDEEWLKIEKMMEGENKPIYLGYSDKECINCGRLRVEKYSDGIEICEKCNYDQKKKEYVLGGESYENQ